MSSLYNVNVNDGKLYPKIDIYVKGKYVASTVQSKTCREAKARYFAFNHGIHIDNIKAKFAKR